MADTFSDGMDPILNLLDERPSEEWEWRFEPAATDRSAVNALALGNAALLAYSDWDDIQHFLGKWQLSDACLLSAGEPQGFVARRDDAVVVSFRGTEPLRLVANKIASSIMTRFAGICPSWKRNWGENQPFKSLPASGRELDRERRLAATKPTIRAVSAKTPEAGSGTLAVWMPVSGLLPPGCPCPDGTQPLELPGCNNSGGTIRVGGSYGCFL
jgi:hypothetical protein